MQLGYAPNFLQRMKFYTLHKFNTLVERGDFDYANLPKLYTIAILEKAVLPTTDFHTIANLRNEQGEIIDSQMSFILVELAKFTKQESEIETDLDKLVYTMKTLHTTEPTKYPAFWNEEWLKKAIEELDTRRMTPEERAYFARVISANAEVVRAEKRKIREALAEKQIETITRLLKRGKLTIEEIAEDNEVSVEFVLQIQRDLALG